MRKLAKVLLAGVAALSLTACGQAEGTTGSSADTTAKEQKQQETPEKIKIQSLNANGEEISLEVPYDPERIAVLDMAALDILDNLGVGDKIVGSASTSLEYLSDYVDNEKVANLGTIKEAYLPADYIRKKYTGRQKTFYFIHFGDREWKPEKKLDFLQYDSVLEACPVKALEYLQIPCMVGRITYREYQKTEYYYTVSEAETVLQKKIMDFLETLDEKGVQIISKDVKIETKRAGWTAHGELLLREAAVSLVDSRAEDTGAEDLDRNED